MSQTANAPLDTPAPQDESVMLASLASISLIKEMQCAQTALLVLSKISLDQGRAPSAPRQQAVTRQLHARVSQDLQEWLEGRRALPVLRANFRMEVGCVCRATPPLVELDNTGKIVLKLQDPQMRFVTIARRWRTQSLYPTSTSQATARGSAQLDFKKIAGQMRVFYQFLVFSR